MSDDMKEPGSAVEEQGAVPSSSSSDVVKSGAGVSADIESLSDVSPDAAAACPVSGSGVAVPARGLRVPVLVLVVFTVAVMSAFGASRVLTQPDECAVKRGEAELYIVSVGVPDPDDARTWEKLYAAVDDVRQSCSTTEYRAFEQSALGPWAVATGQVPVEPDAASTSVPAEGIPVSGPVVSDVNVPDVSGDGMSSVPASSTSVPGSSSSDG
jgi:hypothetical protein